MAVDQLSFSTARAKQYGAATRPIAVAAAAACWIADISRENVAISTPIKLMTDATSTTSQQKLRNGRPWRLPQIGHPLAEVLTLAAQSGHLIKAILFPLVDTASV